LTVVRCPPEQPVGAVRRVPRTLDVELAIRSLFEAPTVEALVQRLGDAQAARPALRSLARPAEIHAFLSAVPCQHSQ
jgi:hypothetical protein